METPHCYTVDEVRDKLHLAKTTFYTLYRSGKLPFLVPLQPQVGRLLRFRADLFEAYLRGEGLAAVRQLRLHRRS